MYQEGPEVYNCIVKVPPTVEECKFMLFVRGQLRDISLRSLTFQMETLMHVLCNQTPLDPFYPLYSRDNDRGLIRVVLYNELSRIERWG